MPGIFYQPIDRRKFLSATVLGSAAGALSGCSGPERRVTTGRQGRVHIALLSDTHIPADRKNSHRGFYPWENLEITVRQVVEARPEAVIVNGDAARLEGLLDDYRELRTLLEPVASFSPVYIGLGNHDERGNFNKTFSTNELLKANIADKHTLVLDQGFMRILVLDSLLYANKTAGLLGRKQRVWLTEYLATHSDMPIVIFVHHT